MCKYKKPYEDKINKVCQQIRKKTGIMLKN